MEESAQVSVPQVPKKSRKKLIIVIAAAVIVIGAAVATILIVSNNNREAEQSSQEKKKQEEKSDKGDADVIVGDSNDAGDGLAPGHDEVYGTSYDKPTPESGE